MYSIDRLDDIWEQELELYGGSYGKPEQVYGTVSYHHIEPRIQISTSVSSHLSDPFQKLPDNEKPGMFRLKVNLETGEISSELLRE